MQFVFKYRSVIFTGCIIVYINKTKLAKMQKYESNYSMSGNNP